MNKALVTILTLSLTLRRTKLCFKIIGSKINYHPNPKNKHHSMLQFEDCAQGFKTIAICCHQAQRMFLVKGQTKTAITICRHHAYRMFLVKRQTKTTKFPKTAENTIYPYMDMHAFTANHVTLTELTGT